jgi:hypothetical protein
MERERTGVEPKLLALSEPAGDGGLEASSHGLAHVQKDDAGSAEQPFEAAGEERVDARITDVDGNLAHRLIGVDHAERAMRVRGGGHPLDVLNGAAREVHVRRHDQRGAIVDRPRNRFDRHRDPVRAFDDDQLDPFAGLGEPLVGDRRTIERGNGPFRAAAVLWAAAAEPATEMLGASAISPGAAFTIRP